MTTEHTPGPWRLTRVRVNEDVHHFCVFIERPETDCTRANPDVCHVYTMGDDGGLDGETHANARLIAAAPELLAACKAVEEYGLKGQTPDGQWPCDMVSAAIAKAKTITVTFYLWQASGVEGPHETVQVLSNATVERVEEMAREWAKGQTGHPWDYLSFDYDGDLYEVEQSKA